MVPTPHLVPELLASLTQDFRYPVRKCPEGHLALKETASQDLMVAQGPWVVPVEALCRHKTCLSTHQIQRQDQVAQEGPQECPTRNSTPYPHLLK